MNRCSMLNELQRKISSIFPAMNYITADLNSPPDNVVSFSSFSSASISRSLLTTILTLSVALSKTFFTRGSDYSFSPSPRGVECPFSSSVATVSPSIKASSFYSNFWDTCLQRFLISSNLVSFLVSSESFSLPLSFHTFYKSASSILSI